MRIRDLVGEHTRLIETMSTSVPYEVQARSRSFHTRATIGARDILFTAHWTSDHDGLSTWLIEFEELATGSTDRLGSTFGRTRGGHALEVLSMVRASIEELVQRYHPDELRFSAETEGGDQTRVKVYKRLMAKAAPTYQLVGEVTDGQVYFTYRSKKVVPAS